MQNLNTFEIENDVVKFYDYDENGTLRYAYDTQKNETIYNKDGLKIFEKLNNNTAFFEYDKNNRQNEILAITLNRKELNEKFEQVYNFELLTPDFCTIRQKAKKTQEQITKLLQIPLQTYCNWEKERRKPKQLTIKAYNDTLLKNDIKIDVQANDLQQLTGKKSGILLLPNGVFNIFYWDNAGNNKPFIFKLPNVENYCMTNEIEYQIIAKNIYTSTNILDLINIDKNAKIFNYKYGITPSLITTVYELYNGIKILTPEDWE